MGITRLSHKPGAPETRNAGKALLKAFSGIMALRAARFWTSNLQNYVRVHFCYLNTKFVVISHKNPGKLRKKESEVAQSCPTLWDPMDCSLPGSSTHGIFQARILEWVAISFSRGSSQPSNRTRVSCIAGRCFTI